MKKGRRNKITDVRGVRVGHKTIAEDALQTGVTVILPTEGDIFREKLSAGCHVINGFGKTSGLVQLEELGTLESPIALTNTLSVGTVQQALVKYMLRDHPEIGTTGGSVNVVVGECNDGYLNDIRACCIQEEDVYDAIKDAKENFELGAVGAGRGMSCFEMKGGIGSASRVIVLDESDYTVGALVLSNFGLQGDYITDSISFRDYLNEQVEQGSIIIVLATDIPMSDRQLKRLCKRMPVALARLGSHLGNGSGDIVIAFSTANKFPHESKSSFLSQSVLHEQQIDKVFRAAIEACEEAIQSSLDAAETVVGREGHCRYSLKDTLIGREKEKVK